MDNKKIAMLNKQELVTIGLPFYNNGKTLKNAIKSVLLQTYKNWELIIIDDGSTDDSFQIAEYFATQDARIILIKDEINKGLVARLNQIIDMASGKFIARMDADDMMMPEKLEKQMEYFARNPSVDVLATASYTIDEKDQPIGIRGVSDIYIRSGKDVIKGSPLIHPTILVKANWYKQNKYDGNYPRAEDYELWCRTFESTVFHRITEPLFFYREGNVSLSNYTLSMKTLRKIIRVYGDTHLSRTEQTIELLKTHIKTNMYRIFGFFKLQYVLSSKRNISLTDEQKIDANKKIHFISGDSKQMEV